MSLITTVIAAAARTASRRPLRVLGIAVAMALGLGAAPACGTDVGVGGSIVGAHCSVPGDCDGTCLVNSHYPDGLCTRACAGDSQCPIGSACIKESDGGFCAVLCTTVATCTDFGPSYVCRGRDRFGASGDVNVCRVP